MSDAAAAEGLRDEVLALTSAFRNALIRVHENDADATVRGAVLAASRALHGCVIEHQVEPLVESSEALQRMTRLWDSQGGGFGCFAAAIGIIEQSLDGWTEGLPAEQLRPLYEALRRTCPSQWHVYLDGDAGTFEARLQAAPDVPVGARTSPLLESSEQAFQRELRAAFASEADEGFAVCEELLVQLEQQPGDRQVLDALFRKFHTLKGAAAAVDFSDAADQLHSGESILQAVRDETMSVNATELVGFLLRLTDSVRGLIDRGCGRSDTPYAIIADVAREIAALSGSGTVVPAIDGLAAHGVASTAMPDAAVTGTDRPDSATIDSQLRVLTELRERLDRGEGGGDIRRFVNALDRQARQFLDLAADLKEHVNSLVSVPLESIFRRLQRPARDAARAEGKLVTLELAGGDTRVNRAMTERLHAVLLHVVRNAVCHGIELPVVRQGRGKHRTGTVRLRAELHDETLVLTIEDDGGGLDLVAIRAKAEALGWVSPRQTLAPAALIRLVFRAGLSTRDAVSELAGRGVGMDVVAREVDALNGAINIESHEGQGTRIRLSIPVEQGDASPNRLASGQTTRTSTVAGTTKPRGPA